MGNIRNLIEIFEEKYSEKLRRIKKNNKEEPNRRKLLDKYMAKILYR